MCSTHAGTYDDDSRHGTTIDMTPLGKYNFFTQTQCEQCI
ncbi:hypothetical protein ISN45_At01g049820 [Arabidopsis thaliana x Arabidopsis arenosa]|uniref:Uncharacterized protein n=1 Tax=Arabidopsis thaliana x Arabidopsis arenosa TaxID=1240361 RepID=A0A8T2GRJ4_9BRAS|nr:hypothetical protein ISN45_At01g049820 [Arabidopsis thaliana x Arabidopsis arenosa]